MKNKPVFYLFAVILPGLILMLIAAFRNEPDPLHLRIFNVSMSETKNGTVAKKVIADKFTFKNGKLRSDFLYDKFGFKYIRYRINKDTSFIDSTDTKVRLLDVEAIQTDEKNQTVQINFVTCEWDIDGVIRITKNDRLKHYYDLAGREKGGKPKKVKKKKTRKPVFEIIKPN